jgi:hypothetical protein
VIALRRRHHRQEAPTIRHGWTLCADIAAFDAARTGGADVESTATLASRPHGGSMRAVHA